MTAKEAVEKRVELVLEQANNWKKHGPETQQDHISGSTVFGVEIECFVPREYANGVNHVSYDELVGKVADSILTGGISTKQLSEYFNIDISIIEDLVKNATLTSMIRFLRTLQEDDPSVSIGGLAFLFRSKRNVSKYNRPTAKAIILSKYPEWRWKYDTSVNGTQDEVVSPKLKGKSGLIELNNVLRTLNDTGFLIDDSCGGHTSLSYRNGVGFYTAPLALFLLWGSLEPKLRKILPNFRSDIRTAKWVSEKYNIADLITKVSSTQAKLLINNLDLAPTEKYQSLSIRNFSNNRAEFRAWAGSLDYTQWAAQVGFGEFVLAQASALSRDFVKLRKDYLENNTKPNNGYKREITNEQFRKWGTSEHCTCEDCAEVIKLYPKDWELYRETINTTKGKNNWVPDGYETEYDI